MRYRFLIFYFFAIAFSLQGQDTEMLKKGRVSYISSQNVYVKFESTESINIGDTLFTNKKGQLMPLLVVDNKSSISCVCTPISSGGIHLSDEIFTQKTGKENPQVEKQLDQQENNTPLESHQPRYRNNNSFVKSRDQSPELEGLTSAKQIEKELPKPIFKQKIRGRVSVTSYNNVSD